VAGNEMVLTGYTMGRDITSLFVALRRVLLVRTPTAPVTGVLGYIFSAMDGSIALLVTDSGMPVRL